MAKIFIDGSAGTTGLRIYERLSERKDISLIKLREEVRKDTAARKEAINSADVVFLCLPDAAAIEAVGLSENPDTVIIDTSTAHRTNPDWTYGFAELGDARRKIGLSKWIANPGCHASGFIALVWPLVNAGILSPDTYITCFSLTGYSGGGKKMIAEYEGADRNPLLCAPRQYGLTQTHKHLPEMKQLCGLTNTPAFSPIVADFYSGMEVSVPLFKKDINGSIADVSDLYRETYQNGLVHFNPAADEAGFLSAAAYAGRDDMEVFVTGNEERMILTARFDNLGKGASGAAIQNMNIVLGIPEKTGLCVKGE
ncbi:MAG: N-acetyl-gamma-glutamyl-phosphate reductase [Ruminococcaceae bacterium]|nr:N-acetyl-gamma-glutamyl-phosphate reductase [Oscillospiraceae bacterium]